MKQNAQYFECARENVLKRAAVHYGRNFENWGVFYSWLLEMEHDQVLSWEFHRIDEWNRLVLAAPSEDGQPNKGLDVEALRLNAENALALFGADANPTRDSAFEFPRGGERQLRVAHQMHDPNSPLNRGFKDWESFDTTS